MSTFRRTIGFVLVCCLLLGVAGVAVAAHTHNWVEVEIYPAECDSLGRTQKTCSECGAVEYVDIPKLGHSWGPYVTIHPATCTAKAIEQSICSRCETKDVRETGAPIAHQMTGWKTIKEATCTEDGYKENKCLTCTTQYDSTPIGRLGHDWGAGWVVDVDPKCGVAGLEKRECSRCKTVETRALKALQHNFSAWKATQAVACDKDEIESRECSLCKTIEKRTTKKAWGHKFSDWKVDIKPSCDKVGKQSRQCPVCSKVETAEIKKLPHTSNKIWETVREATLSKLGLQVTHCTVCGQQASSRNVAPRGYRYEVPTYAYGPLAGEYPGGGSGSTLRLIYLNLTENSDQRHALVTEDGWLIGYARVTVAGGTVKVSLEKASDPTVMRYRAWGMFPDPATARAVNYDNSLPFDQAVKGPGDSCVIAVNMISNYYQGRENQQFSDALMSPSGASYGELNQAMLQMAEGSEE